jgi:methylenetetrahydrofolate dehydrogenase (NADP+)/methenyltetrahydrofolate cyclohydrolase
MTEPLILDGKTLAKSTEADLSLRVEAIKKENGGRTPILATILVGSDPASATYVRMKGNACRRVGMDSLVVTMPENTTTEELLAKIDGLNSDRDVQGILLQHPVPSQIDERACFDQIAIAKDVDGVTAIGFGLMSMGEPVYGSATPAGIIKILDHYGIEMEGKHAVVIGRSPILGKPVAMMLLNRNATVTICHSRTQGLPAVVASADIVVAAVGRPRFVKGDWIKPGAVIVDAGFHPEGCGDVDLEVAAARSSAYTPVPGGVGPMTISTLISQTVDAAEKSSKLQETT